MQASPGGATDVRHTFYWDALSFAPADGITASAPVRPGRLGGAKRTKARRKGAEQDDHRVRLAYAVRANCDAGHGKRRDRGAPLRTRDGGGTEFLRGTGRSGPGGDRSHRVRAVVRANAAGARPRVVDRRCPCDPRETSSGGRERLGRIRKQGNTLVRFLLGETARTVARTDPELRRDYQRRVFRRGKAVAKGAIARKLAVRLYGMLRETTQSAPPTRTQGSPASPGVGETRPTC